MAKHRALVLRLCLDALHVPKTLDQLNVETIIALAITANVWQVDGGRRSGLLLGYGHLALQGLQRQPFF